MNREEIIQIGRIVNNFISASGYSAVGSASASGGRPWVVIE